MATTILKFEVTKLDLPLVNPFVIATGVRTVAFNVLIKVFLDNGVVGLGEVSPPSSAAQSAQTEIIELINKIIPFFMGKAIEDFIGLIEKMHTQFPNVYGAQSGIELALYDAFTKCNKSSLFNYFGGKSRRLMTDITIPIGTTENALNLANQYIGEGFRALKMKVGKDRAADFERVLAVSKIDSSVAIYLDANQGYTKEEAYSVCQNLVDHGVNLEMFEQPVKKDDWEGLKYLTSKLNVEIAADESVVTFADAQKLVEGNYVDVINIKLHKSGLVEAVKIIEFAQKNSVTLMIGAMMESPIGLSASVQLACGTNAFTYCDLDTVYLLKPTEYNGGFSYKGPEFTIL
ncbi:MAG: dipeptide epimerase [Bacteriovoracaceae bacterium]